MTYTDLFRALNGAGVRYLIAGGFAVNLYGYVRLTVDLDLALAMDEQNLEAAITVLTRLGYAPRVPVPAAELVSPEKRREWIAGKGALVFTFVQPVVGLETLIAMKKSVGRPRDLSDVEQLERIKALKKSGRIP